MLARIAHTTDFSADSDYAFTHALRIALAARARLDILHVHDPRRGDAWNEFPHVRATLTRWGMIPSDATPADIERRLGVHVAKVEIKHADPVGGIATFFQHHRPDLLVVATHGRDGINRWLHGSVTEDVVARTRVPTLMIGPDSTGFVDDRTGALDISQILLPVTSHPDPAVALLALSRLLQPLGAAASTFQLLNVGNDVTDILSPAGPTLQVDHRTGAVVDTILAEAEARLVDLIAMPTSGRHGLLDAFRGSTTSRVLAQAKCPVLTLPIPAG